MKTKNLLLGLALSALALQSCNVLDIDPTDTYSESTAYASIKNLDLYVKSFYGVFYSNADINVGANLAMDDGVSDLIKYSWFNVAEGSVNKLFYYDNMMSPDGNYRSNWDGMYEQIRRFNEYFYDVHRSSEDDCWTFILDEYEKAAQMLPEEWTGSEAGRLTKGAAYGMKARAALYAKRWQDAVNAALEVEKLEKKGVYQLLSGTSKDSYMQIFNTVNNKELILPVYFQQKTKQHMFNHFFCPPYDTEKAGLQPGTLGAAATPTDEYASAFDIKVGQEWKSFDWTHLNEYSEGPWGNRDPRFYASILYNGANWTGRQLELYVGGKDGYMDFSTSASQDYVRTSTTGYIFRKFMDESDNINYVDIESTSYWIEMRYAEIILILSEAYARLDKFKEAYDYLNKIRTRVGLPILAQQSTWDNYLEDLSKERVCELGLEGHRWYDLVRWDIAQKVLNGQRLHGIKIEKTGSSFLYTRVECDTQDRKFPKKYNIFPIPSSELRNNIMCEQTPSWK